MNNWNDIKEKLEQLYRFYNHKKYIDPDPLIFVHNFISDRDTEIAALIASCLAYGNVKQIKKSINNVLKKMGESPFDFLMKTKYRELTSIFSFFKHRFTTSEELCDFLYGIKVNIEKYGSLEKCFLAGYSSEHHSTYPSLCLFVQKLKLDNSNQKNSLLPIVEKGSASKRLHLFLRWMVRKDNVDLGLWKNIDISKLLIPLDTHIFRIARFLKMTKRKSPDLKSVIEITKVFQEINPDDPIKYDFCLTRLGIRDENNFKDVFENNFTFVNESN